MSIFTQLQQGQKDRESGGPVYSSVSALHLQGDLQLILLPNTYGQQEFERTRQMCRGNAAQGPEAVPKEGTQGTE